MIGRLYPPLRGSSGRLLRELARAFARDGWNVRVLTTAPAAGYDVDGAVHVRRLRYLRPHFGIVSGLVLLLRLFFAGLFSPRPALVITLSDPPLLVIVGAWISRLRGVPHLHWCQDVYPDLLPFVGVSCPGWVSRALMRASRAAMNRAAGVIVTGRCMARHLSATGVDSHVLTLIPPWPELAMNAPAKPAAPFPPIEVAGAATTPKFRVLYVGTVGAVHPVDTILDAATILESLHPEIEFVFIGDDQAHAAVAAEKARRGGLSNVRILPFQPQSRLRDIMESGDLHLISLRQDVAGLVVPAKFYAAMASARPCILVGPEACEIARVILDYKIGAVVPQKSAQLLAQTIIDYRLRDDLWFAAQEGAIQATQAYRSEDMIRLWLQKARVVARISG